MERISPDELSEIGQRIYNTTNWKTPMARDLGVGIRTVRGWANSRRKLRVVATRAVRHLEMELTPCKK